MRIEHGLHSWSHDLEYSNNVELLIMYDGLFSPYK